MSEQDFYPPRIVTAPSRANRPQAVAAKPGNLTAILARIEEAVEAETAAIRTDVKFDLTASNARKSRHLYELNKAARDLDPSAIDAESRAGLARLRQKLVANEEAIRAHLAAVNEVANMLRTAIERSEADGTYDTSAFGRMERT